MAMAGGAASMHPKHILPGMEDCQEGRVSSKTPSTWQSSQMAGSSCLRIRASSSKAEKCSVTDPSQESLVWLNCLLFQAGSEGSIGLKSHTHCRTWDSVFVSLEALAPY